MPACRGKSLLTFSVIFLGQITRYRIVATKGVNKFEARTHVGKAPYKQALPFTHENVPKCGQFPSPASFFLFDN